MRYKPPGVSSGDDSDWHCQICNRGVKNEADAVRQHCKGTTHLVNCKNWGNKPLVPYLCKFCVSSIATTMDGRDDATKIRAHNKLRSHLEAVEKATSHVDAAAPPHLWHCATCNINMSADVAVVTLHNNSKDHARLVRFAAEEHRDGQELAKQARDINGGAVAAPPQEKNAKRKRK